MEEKYTIAPCGIYCGGVCAIYIADRDNHRRLKEIIAAQYDLTPEDVHCDGCRSESPFAQCQSCTVRDCVISRDIEGCFACGEFPCHVIEDMTDMDGKKAILFAVPAIRELGLVRYKAEAIEHYRCPQCGHQLFMGAKRCRNCSSEVELD